MLTLNRHLPGFSPADLWSHQLDHMFDSLLSSFSGGLFPALNMAEDDKQVYVEAEMPGVRSTDIEVSVHGHELKLTGQRKLDRDDKSKFHLLERGGGAFERTLQLPCPVNPDQITAEIKDGILTVTMQKAQTPRRIDIKVAQ